MNEHSAYDEFARDPSFPCPACPADGKKCRRLCPEYRLWVAIDWINMQNNAGIISEKVKEERIKRAHERYEESKRSELHEL